MSRYLSWLAALVVVLVVVVAYLAVQAWQDDRCQSKGGHLVNVYKGTICVSADGRILE